MIQALSSYFYDRRRGLAKTAGMVGGVYLVGRYVRDRLEEVKDKVTQERLARDSLRRRFVQNQEDISYTIMTLIPTLGEQILVELDVEGVTQELQARSKTSRIQLQPPQPPSESSLTSSIEILQEQDTPSDVESASLSSFSGHDEVGQSSNLTESSQSWEHRFQKQSASEHPPPATDASLAVDPASFLAEAQLSDSMTTASSALSYGNEAGPSHPEEQTFEPSGGSTKSKGELWKEVKILTFTRTLTTIYSTTLLSLFTSVQLTLLARSKYVQSVLRQEQDERLREQLELGASVSGMLWSGIGNLLDMEHMAGYNEDGEGISEQVEIKYLTLSWWILHAGWKDIAERVRRGVEEVFDDVSLKTKLGAMELHRLVGDVRRRVEHEVTFEGNERRINFLSSLLPPTTETMQHVLTQGGISSYFASHHDPTFTSLLDETRSLIMSSDFELVLEIALDRATDVLFDGLQKNVFIDSTSLVDASGQEPLKLRLAGLLPGLARWSHLALNGLPNELVDNLTRVREVVAFSAIVFSSFEDKYR